MRLIDDTNILKFWAAVEETGGKFPLNAGDPRTVLVIDDHNVIRYIKIGELREILSHAQAQPNERQSDRRQSA